MQHSFCCKSFFPSTSCHSNISVCYPWQCLSWLVHCDDTVTALLSACTCWMIRDLLVVQKISLLEIISAAVLLANVVVVVVVDLLESSMLLTQATLQVTHRCTHAPYGILAALPTGSSHSELTNYLGQNPGGTLGTAQANPCCWLTPTGP